MAKRKVLTEPVEPWVATKQAELRTKPDAERGTLIYLLVDEDGAQLIAEGTCPDYVVKQAQDALDWNLSDLYRPVQKRAAGRQP